MKRKSLFIVLFVVGFAAVYMIMSFAIPGFRIKLEAEPAVVFVAAGTRKTEIRKSIPRRMRRGMLFAYFFFLSMGLPSMPTGPLPLMAR